MPCSPPSARRGGPCSPASSGALVDWLDGDWGTFFVITTLMVIPSLVCLWAIRKRLGDLLAGARVRLFGKEAEEGGGGGGLSLHRLHRVHRAAHPASSRSSAFDTATMPTATATRYPR